MLRLESVSSYYGKICAISDVSLEVTDGEIVTLIGANGAGKSTTLMTISGIVRPRTGRIYLGSIAVNALSAHEIVRHGVIQVPEGRRVLPLLTVEENLDLGAFTKTARQRDENRERVYALFPRLWERRKQLGGTLSGGEQQMLAIGRALMAAPRLLLLDEPSLGLAPKMVDQIFQIIREINASGTTILLVEQNAAMALELAHRAYVLETGRVVLAGEAAKLRDDPALRRAYLGA
jgi:branched-chain amino acid transport system ATP-binding protein